MTQFGIKIYPHNSRSSHYEKFLYKAGSLLFEDFCAFDFLSLYIENIIHLAKLLAIAN